MADNGTSDLGSVCLIVSDFGENHGEDTSPFEEVCTMPGAMVRKVWQNVSNIWFPTEPSDREFHDVDGDDGVLTVCVRHSIAKGTLNGRLLALVNASFRGRNTDRCKQALALLRSHSELDGFESLELASPEQRVSDV